jgi:uncharacterized membrane protein YwaF
MLTFLEFYSTMLRFVHFRLYHSALSAAYAYLLVVLTLLSSCSITHRLQASYLYLGTLLLVQAWERPTPRGLTPNWMQLPLESQHS